ncbi:hypothetical protein Fcan01_18831 [Folsomia candida]|uniref:Uncharacterized protein n=1 Tax=Folsomia candida TaxID=158441 RepID=A0A226DN89_FOLCA|nr:hypothetical protein Fcan01_18831 [Folsomia candida]
MFLGFALQCFICNNFDNPTGCGHGDEGKDQQFLKDCDDPQQNPDYDEASRDRIPLGAKYEFCRKIVTSIEFDVNTNKATERITRKCGYLPSQGGKYDEECYYRGGFGGRQRTCTCKGNACNGAFNLGASGALLAGAVAVVYSATKLF